MSRIATRSRTTAETSIELSVNLDGSGQCDVSTGIPFYDHMLSQVGKHGGFDLRIAAKGDLHIDTHHTVEDVAMTLGEMVFVANGSNEVLQTVLLTFAGPGRTVATFEPTYQLHSHIARITGATVIEGERSTDFSLDVNEVRRVINEFHPHVTFLCSPNNPTGGVDSPELVAEVLALSTGLVVVDEAYGQFAPWSALELINEETPLVVTRTFSKTWSMAAARLGYLIGPRWLVAELDKVVLPYHLDTAKQIAGTLAVQFQGDMEERVRTIVAERERLVNALASLDVDVFESGANFILVRPRSKSGRTVWQGLLDRSVLIRDCSSWPRLADCLRVTIGTPEQDDIFLKALTEVLS